MGDHDQYLQTTIDQLPAQVLMAPKWSPETRHTPFDSLRSPANDVVHGEIKEIAAINNFCFQREFVFGEVPLI